MNVTNRLFTYPILSGEKHDYNESKFNVEYEDKKDINKVDITLDFEINCVEIKNLIANNQAEYVIHFECKKTGYREAISSNFMRIEHTLPLSRINGTLEMVGLVVLKQKIEQFKSADWVDDFDGISFDLMAGQILAYKNLDSLEISKDYEEFKNAESIFSIYKRAANNEQIADIELNAPKIKIGLPTSDYERYIKHCANFELQPILNSILVFPALVYLVSELRQVEDDMYQNLEWYVALEQAYKKRGQNFVQDINDYDKTSYQIAQEIMELPICAALSGLDDILIIPEGEDD